jgi:hypothetical protein
MVCVVYEYSARVWPTGTRALPPPAREGRFLVPRRSGFLVPRRKFSGTALSDEHNDHDGVEPRRERLPHQGEYDRRTWRLACLGPRDLAPRGRSSPVLVVLASQWGNLDIAHVGAQADQGGAGRRVSAQEATEPHIQRKATAARGKTQSQQRTGRQSFAALKAKA